MKTTTYSLKPRKDFFRFMEDITVAIVGGGLVGLAIAREFSSKLGPHQVVVFEKNYQFGMEQSGHSSEVVHCNIYNEGLKAKLCRPELLHEFCHQYNIPLLKTGKLIVAGNEQEDQIIDELRENGRKNEVPGVEKIGSNRISELEDNIKAYSALFCPSTAIINSATYVQRLVELNRDLGTYLYNASPVEAVEPSADTFDLQVGGRGQQRCTARIVINAAGLYSDHVAKLINQDNSYEIVPVKGEYYSYTNEGRFSVKRNVYPVPWCFQHNGRTYYDLGVHLTPLADGKTVRVGPAVKPAATRRDYTSEANVDFFISKTANFFDPYQQQEVKQALKQHLKRDYVGIIAEEKNTHDFIIEQDKLFPRCLHLVGIESPGLTASLSLAQYSWQMMREML